MEVLLGVVTHDAHAETRIEAKGHTLKGVGTRGAVVEVEEHLPVVARTLR